MLQTRNAFAHLILISLLLITLATGAFAETADAPKLTETQLKIKALCESFLERISKGFVNQSTGVMQRSGDIVLTSQGEFTSVTLPYLRIAGQGGVFDIGKISLNIAPDSKAGYWKVAFALPQPMFLRDESNTVLFRLDLGSQKSAGIWSQELEQFVVLDSTIENIVFSFQTHAKDGAKPVQEKVTIPRQSIKVNFVQNAQGMWSGPYEVLSENLKGEFKNALIDANSIKINGNLKDYNLKLLHDAQRKIEAYFIEMENAQKDMRMSNPQFTKDLQDAGTAMIFDTGDSSEIAFEVQGLKIHNLNQPQIQVQDIGIGKMNIATHAKDFKSALAQLGGTIMFEGLTLSPTPPSTDALSLVPAEFSTQWSLRDIPIAPLRNLANQAAASATMKSEMGMLGVMGAVFQVPVILAQNGSYLDFKQTAKGVIDYAILHTGKYKVDPMAATSFVGKSELEVKNFEKIITTLEGTKDSNKDAIKNMRTFFAAGKTVGDTTRYDLELTPAGVFTVNGQDVHQLFPEAKTPSAAPEVIPNLPPPAGTS